MIADRVSELQGINDLIFAAKEKQRELETIEEVSELSKGSDETDVEEEARQEHGGGATDRFNVSSLVSASTIVPPVARSLAELVGTCRDLHPDQRLLR